MVEDEIHDLQPNFDEPLSDKVLVLFKENLKSIAQSTLRVYNENAISLCLQQKCHLCHKTLCYLMLLNTLR